MADWYKWLWSHIGGRPWTYIIRDSYHANPLPWIAGLIALGTLLGHLFWGTPWVINQGG